MDRRYKWKLWTVLVLSVLIMLGLGYLTYLRRGGTPKPVADVTPTPTAEPTAEPTVEPTAETSAEPTSDASADPSAETSADPSAETTPDPVCEETPAPDGKDQTPYVPEVDIDSDDSIYKLVNISWPVSSDYAPADLRVVNVPSSENEYLREEAADAFERMYQDARDNQVYLRIVDGYRSYQEQLDLYNYYIRQHGKAYTEYVDDHPGASEHQLGLAVDLGWYNGNCQLNPCIATYPQYQWLLDNSYKYGWIQRYPDKKTDVTHITYSPWHFRYVGSEMAEKIHDSGLTMEEYFHRPVTKQ